MEKILLPPRTTGIRNLLQQRKNPVKENKVKATHGSEKRQLHEKSLLRSLDGKAM